MTEQTVASPAENAVVKTDAGLDVHDAELPMIEDPELKAPEELFSEDEEFSEDGTTPADGSVAASLLAGIVGCIVGMILCALGGGMTSTPGMFLFLLIPLLIGGANLLFRGIRRIPGLVITIVFSALGVWLVPSLTAAAMAARKQGLSILSVPLIALSRIGTANYFTNLAFDTAHVFPVLFAAIGILIAWEVYRLKKN